RLSRAFQMWAVSGKRWRVCCPAEEREDGMMSQHGRGRLFVGLALVSCIASLTAVLFIADDAEAQRGRRGRARRAAAAATPDEATQSEAIAPALGELRWGMSPEQTFNHLKTLVEGAYRDRLVAARTDTILEDRVRQQMTAEVRRVRSTYVRFRGD